MEMTMTKKLADQLMDTLACVAISAMGGVIQHEDGTFDHAQMAYAQMYARNTFCELLEAWEEMTGKGWNIIMEEEE
jgi:hypothetical protein